MLAMLRYYILIPIMQRNEVNYMNYDFIRGRMAELRICQRDVAQMMGISVQSFNRKINAKRAFTVGEATKLCDILDIPSHKRAEIFLPCLSQKRNEI